MQGSKGVTGVTAGRAGTIAGGVATAALLLLATGALAAGVPEAVAYCQACHGEEGFTLELEDGSSMSLDVDAETFLGSVHGDELICTDCHEGYEDEHPLGATFSSEREYEIAAYDTCKKCHFDTYTRTLESVHYDYLKEGFEGVPVCTDCHGTHDIHDPHQKRAMVSRSCAECHTGVYQVYAESVHGRALVEANNQDVPACADCHTAHRIRDPGTVAFHVSSPQQCIRCHADEKLMAPYGIPTTVASTYLSDFHGVTASLADPEEIEDRQLVVTCIDCHGVHDIASPALLSEARMKERVRSVCSDCHEGAASDFPAAWLSHYQPSLDHAPLVYLVELFYKIFIPFMVVGLLLQVLLHLYRVTANR